MATKDDVPTYDELLNPTLQALHNLGGSGSNDEIVDGLISVMGLPDELAEIPHGRGGRTEITGQAVVQVTANIY